MTLDNKRPDQKDNRMVVQVMDHDRQIFNLIDLGPGFRTYGDPRCDRLVVARDQIVSTTGRRIEVTPFAVPLVSVDTIRDNHTSKGYRYDRTWYPTRRFRDEFMPKQERQEAVVIVSEKENGTSPAVADLLKTIGLGVFNHSANLPDWQCRLYEEHVGSWEDTGNGAPDLVCVPESRQAQLAVVCCSLLDPCGKDLVDTVLDCFDGTVPVIVVVPSDQHALRMVSAVMRKGIEAVIEAGEGFLEELENVILDSPLVS